MFRLAAVGGALVLGQMLGGLQGGPIRAKVLPAELSYVAEPAVVDAGRRSVLEVHLRQHIRRHGLDRRSQPRP